MGVQPPFLYEPVSKESPLHAFGTFDPKAVSRASLIPPAPRPTKPEGPLLNLNRHPDSWFQLPYGKTEVPLMSTNIKSRVAHTRIAQLILRCFEVLAGLGLLASMILVSNVQTQTGLLMRIPPGVAVFHAVYGVYHLSRKSSGRSALSSASYMLFAACADVALLPFYGFSALMAESQYQLSTKDSGSKEEWSSLLSAGQDLVTKLSGVIFLIAVIGGVFHLVSLGLSLWLAVIFRKIGRLPPDMNPLDDEVKAGKHSRNKSSVSANSSISLTPSEARITAPLESKRNSGAPYEELNRPPNIPFLATRSSNNTLPSYRSISPGKRDSGVTIDLPPRQYLYNHSNGSQTDSRSETGSSHPPTSPTRPQSRGRLLTEKRDVWLGADSLTLGSKKPAYHAIPQDAESGDISSNSYTYSPKRNSHPKPLTSHPSDPAFPPPNFSRRELSPPPSSPKDQPRISILSAIELNKVNGQTSPPEIPHHSYNTRATARAPSPSAYSESVYSEDQVSINSSVKQSNKFSSPVKQYGGLGNGMVVTVGADRNVSSGNDVITKRSYRRDVSGKIAEEGRSPGGWGTRFRNVSGI